MSKKNNESITINKMSKEITSYNKNITFNYKGKEYECLLLWDNSDGYELSFFYEETPLWAIEWEDDHPDYEQSLEYFLDELSDKQKKDETA